MRPPNPLHASVISPNAAARIQPTEANELRFQAIMRNRLHARIVNQAEDGNCLFRSVSHQVYGSAEHHILVRASCMAYVAAEKHFFQDFIAGEAFDEYIARMQMDGQWGDNVELQAMSEIYERPIEIYAYSHVPLKTFMAASSAASSSAAAGAVAAAASPAIAAAHRASPPIQLSYHFASHYNSVVPLDTRSFLATCTNYPPGYLEEAAMERAATLRRLQEAQRSAVAAAAASHHPPSSQLSAARSQFSSSHMSSEASALDVGAAASLAELDAVFAAETAEAQRSSLREADDAQLLQAALDQSDRDDLDKMIVEAARAEARADAEPLPPDAAAAAAAASLQPASGSVEQAVLARALAASLAAAPPGTALAAASEEEQLKQALRLSSGADAEDAALQAALRASVGGAGAAAVASVLPPAVSACVELGFSLEQSVQAFEVCGGADSAATLTNEQLLQRMTDFLYSS